MIYTIYAYVSSSQGNVRGNNEDSYYFDGFCPNIGKQSTRKCLKQICSTRKRHCFGVFDGMGGGLYGEQASFIAAHSLSFIFDTIENIEEWNPEDVLNHIYSKMNQAVCKKLEQIKASQMGTTAAMLLFQADNAVVSNVGDSKIFRFRNQQGKQLSRDHTDSELLKRLHIKNTKPVLTQYIGMNEDDMILEPFVKQHSLRNNDYYLICSDGLTDMVSMEQMEQVINEKTSLKRKIENLNRLAYEAGARDNVTIILCRIKRRWGI